MKNRLNFFNFVACYIFCHVNIACRKLFGSRPAEKSLKSYYSEKLQTPKSDIFQLQGVWKKPLDYFAK